MAPSAHNAHHWRFIVLPDGGLKQRLAETMAEDWGRDLREDGLPSEECERFTEASIKAS